MGQTVLVRNTNVVDNVLLIDTDRSLTGQDSHVMTPDDPGGAVPGILAQKLFELDADIDHVHVLQNTISVRRRPGWDAPATARVEGAVAEFLRFYEV